MSGPGGNLYDKYTTRNPVARWLMARFLRELDEVVAGAGVTRLLEVGCGEGYLARRLRRAGFEVLATEPDAQTAEKARELCAGEGLDLEVQRAGIEELDPARHAAPLVLCCEVLEHVADPAAAVDHLHALAAPWLVASVPREPLWRTLNMARGAYWGAWGNTPGHLNHWSRREFLALLGRRFEVVEVRTPLPWVLTRCRARR